MGSSVLRTCLLRFSIVAMLCLWADASLYAQDFCLRLNEIQLIPSSGIQAQRSREYVELYNTSDVDSVDLTGFWMRTDGQNNINNPTWLQDEIVTWQSRFGATMPIDLVAGPLITNQIKIPPQTIAVILTPSWNLFNTWQDDIPNNTIILTLKSTNYWGGNTFAPAIPNSLFWNAGDYCIIYDGSPLIAGSQMIDSVRWSGNAGTDKSLQRDNDCVWRWHGSAFQNIPGGHPKDLDNSILSNNTLGAPNFSPLNPNVTLQADTLCAGDSTAYSYTPWACVDSAKWDFGDPQSGPLNVDSGTTAQHIWNNTGTFTVSLFVWSACHTDTFTTTVIVASPPNVNLGPDTVVCNGGSITLQSNIPAMSYLWNTGDTIKQITVTTPGMYSIVADSFGCVGYDTVLVGLSIPIPIDLGNDTTDCTGGPIPLNAGAGFATYQWSNGPQSQTQSIVTTGIYSVIGTDTAGCKVFDTIDIKIGLPPNLSINGVDATCYQFADGSATVSATGLSPFNYAWSNSGANQPTANGLAKGNYTVVVTDPIGCEDSISVFINEPNELTLSIWTKDETCPGFLDGEVITNVSGGTPPYSYSWSNSALTPSIVALAPGVYSVNINDSKGCNISGSATINTKPSPVVTAFGNPNFCEGDAGDTLFSSVVNGTAPYYWTWWCDSSVTWCGLDSVFDDDPIAQPTQSAWYYVQVVDNNGCPSNIDSIFVTVKPKPIVDAGPDVFICPDSAPCAILQPTISGAPGPFIYEWTPAIGLNDSTVLNPCARPDTTTIYTLTVYSLGNGCNSKKTTVDTNATVTVHVNPLPIAQAHLPGPDIDLCDGDCVTLQGFGSGAGPNYNYQWSPSAGLSNPNIANPQACPQLYTEYVLTVWSNGCPSYGDTVRIHVHGLPTADAGPDVQICPGDSGQLQGQGWGDPLSTGYTYLWTPGSAIVPNNTLENPLGTSDTTMQIYLTAFSSFGCASPLDSMTLHVIPAPQAEAGPNLVLCTGHELNLEGGYFFFTSDTTADKTQFFYDWTPTDSLFDPTDPKTIATPDQTITYYLRLQYQDCESTDSMLVTVIPEVIASAIADTQVICENDSLTLFGSGGIGQPNVQWLPSQGIDDPNSSTTTASPPTSVQLQYVVEEGGCRDTANLPIEVIPVPDIHILASNDEGCVPHTISMMETGANSIAYTWDFGDGTALSNEKTVNHTYPQPGKYAIRLLASNIGGCTTTDSSITIHVHDTALADFHTDPVLPAKMLLGNAHVNFIDNSQRASSWVWNFGDEKGTASIPSPTYTYDRAGVFYVTLQVANDFGCLSSVQKGPIIVEAPDLLIPNIFTPNGDGNNDRFLVTYLGDQPFSLTIFDRWGVNHFVTKNKMDGWKGLTLQGDPVAEGVYYYVVTIGKKEYAGEVTLMR